MSETKSLPEIGSLSSVELYLLNSTFYVEMAGLTRFVAVALHRIIASRLMDVRLIPRLSPEVRPNSWNWWLRLLSHIMHKL